jgi:polyferredoxin
LVNPKIAIAASVIIGSFIFFLYHRPYLILGTILGIVLAILTFTLLTTEKTQPIRRGILVYYSIITWIGTLAIFFFIGIKSLAQWVSGHLRVYYFSGLPTAGKTLLPCNWNLPQIMTSISLQGAQANPGIGVRMPSTAEMALFVILPFIIMAVIFGRGFCGWACYFGGAIEIFISGRKKRWTMSKFRKKYKSRGQKVQTLDGLKEEVKDIKYGLALAIILLGLSFSIPAICVICWTWLIQYAWLGLLMLGSFILLGIILPYMTKKRWWCIFCPVGALINLIESVTPFYIKMNKKVKCKKCNYCVEACPTYALTRQTLDEIEAPNVDCIKCGTCINACPENVLDVYIRGTSIRARPIFYSLSLVTGMLWYAWFMLVILQIIPILFHL